MPLQQLKHKLLVQKVQLERQLNAIHHDFQQGRSADSAEQAAERENEQVLNSLEHNAAEELKQINIALQRMEHGEYLHCSQCGEDIGVERLNAVPFTTLCISCANTPV
ncbi:transcriptional regulator, TraR/DksA family [Arsukibacterium tuosuense]|uniref:Transcriptional regulator, TraR/DksA family n=1 Tax=Arsukibacterium tuosuense TaxID=1323745 RepID=A0A285IC67_9GAMM|nr:TraR/DksA family transcriptional regulator [Arsukibacterium tuosuense]SNY45523.1 transcriptional regulator, TraR/DksA family [Arsukibacterium tuosuense]